MANKSLREYVYDLVETTVTELGYELVDVEYKNPGGPWKLTIFIYKQDGITLEDCELVSRTIDPMLDEDKFVCDKYDFLQVSSPGLDRPIKTLKDYQRHISDKLEISLYFPLNGSKKLTGTLVAASDDNVEIEVDGDRIEIETKQIAKSALAIEFK